MIHTYSSIDTPPTIYRPSLFSLTEKNEIDDLIKKLKPVGNMLLKITQNLKNCWFLVTLK